MRGLAFHSTPLFSSPPMCMKWSGKMAAISRDESIEKFVGAFARRIHHRIEDAKLPLDVERAGRAGEIGIPDEPGTGVSRHVELGHDPDAAVACIGDDFASLLLGVEQPVGTQSRSVSGKPCSRCENPGLR